MSEDFPFHHFLKVEEKSSKIDNLPPVLFEDNETNESPNENEFFTSEELGAIQDELLKHIKGMVTPQKYNAFFNNVLTLAKIDESMAHFAVPTAFIQTMVTKSYKNVLKQALIATLGRQYEVNIHVNQPMSSASEQHNNDSNSLKSKENHKSFSSSNVKDFRFNLDLLPNEDDLKNKVDSKVIDHLTEDRYGRLIDSNKTFDNFVVGPSNNMAHGSAMAVAKNPGKIYPSLYLHSNSGLGKTHLLHSIANYVKETRPELKVCFTTAREFMNEMVDAIQNKKMDEFRRKYSEIIDILMIDDVHELKNKTGTQNEFFHVFNELHNKGKQLIFTSDKPPKEIDGLEERVRTRLSWGLVVDIHQPDLETRIAIVKKKAFEEDIYLPDDVINLIATSIKSNIRELEGSIIRLGAYSSLFKVDIDMEIAKEQLNLTEDHDPKHITLEQIAKIVSNYFKIPIPDLRSKARIKEITTARHIAMYLSHKIVQATLMDIGYFYGRRDHTSVMHAVTKIKTRMKSDGHLATDIINIENLL